MVKNSANSPGSADDSNTCFHIVHPTSTLVLVEFVGRWQVELAIDTRSPYNEHIEPQC
jgi:hypothetical protein